MEGLFTAVECIPLCNDQLPVKRRFFRDHPCDCRCLVVFSAFSALTHRLALIWFALQCSKSKQCTEIHGYDHMPVSWGYMRAQYLLLMAPSRLEPHRPMHVDTCPKHMMRPSHLGGTLFRKLAPPPPLKNISVLALLYCFC